MSNLQNEQCMEEKYEQIKEDFISKKDLANIIEFVLTRLHKEIQSEKSDNMVRSFAMYMHKITRDKVKEVDDHATDKADNFCEENTDYWHGEEPLSYDGYEQEDLSDMDREEPCI